jgi:hypothetical protein
LLGKYLARLQEIADGVERNINTQEKARLIRPGFSVSISSD